MSTYHNNYYYSQYIVVLLFHNIPYTCCDYHCNSLWSNATIIIEQLVCVRILRVQKITEQSGLLRICCCDAS